MSLSYDQTSFVRMVFEEAYVPVLFRRRAERIRQNLDIKLAVYDEEVVTDMFPTRIIDYSTTGFGILHPEPFELGSRFILALPRPTETSLSLVLRTVRCHPSVADSAFEIGLEYDSVLDAEGNLVWGQNLQQQCKKKSRPRAPLRTRTRVMFALFGIFGIAIGAML